MDRRSLITSGFATVVAVGVAPAAFAAPTSAFERALAEWRSERAIFANGYIPDEVANAAVTRIDKAFGRLLATPSRDARDIVSKLEALAIEYEGCEFDSERVLLIAQDARRLVKEV